jgi:hypothetical protein
MSPEATALSTAASRVTPTYQPRVSACVIQIRQTSAGVLNTF